MTQHLPLSGLCTQKHWTAPRGCCLCFCYLWSCLACWHPAGLAQPPLLKPVPHSEHPAFHPQQCLSRHLPQHLQHHPPRSQALTTIPHLRCGPFDNGNWTSLFSRTFPKAYASPQPRGGVQFTAISGITSRNRRPWMRGLLEAASLCLTSVRHCSLSPTPRGPPHFAAQYLRETLGHPTARLLFPPLQCMT